MSDSDSRLRDRRDVEVPVDSVDPVDSVGSDSGSGGGFRSRIRSRAGSVFSARTFLLGTVFCLAGLVVVGGALPLGSIGDLFGILVAGFVLGAVTEGSRYLELGFAGAAAGGIAAFLDHLVLALFGVGMPLVALGVVGGAVTALVGHYFGNDLRNGLTRDLSQ